MLDKWTSEQRAFYLACRATGVARYISLKKVLEEFESEEPHPYVSETLGQAERTGVWKELFANAQDELRKEAVEHLYAHEGSRVHALNEMAQKTISALREIESPEKKARDWSTLSDTAVKCLREIREEIGPNRAPSKEDPVSKMLSSLTKSKDPRAQALAQAISKGVSEEDDSPAN